MLVAHHPFTKVTTPVIRRMGCSCALLPPPIWLKLQYHDAMGMKNPLPVWSNITRLRHEGKTGPTNPVVISGSLPSLTTSGSFQGNSLHEIDSFGLCLSVVRWWFRHPLREIHDFWKPNTSLYGKKAYTISIFTMFHPQELIISFINQHKDHKVEG